MSNDKPHDFMLQVEIGPLYEPWTLLPRNLEREFEWRDDRYVSGWSISDPLVGTEVRNPFRVKMHSKDSLFLIVVSRDWNLNVTGAEVTFKPIPDKGGPRSPDTPFGSNENPWAELRTPPVRFPYPPDKAGWVWPDSEREEIAAADGIWDLSVKVFVEYPGELDTIVFGFDPRMCVGGGC